MAKVNGEYWAQRIAELEEKLLLSGEEYLKRLGAETAKAIRRTEADIARWYNRFAKNNKITLAEAKKWLTAKELKELRWTVDEYIEYAEANELDPRWVKELENASARVHISRLEALKLDLRHSAEAIGAFQKNGAVKVFETVYKDGYFRTCYEFQRALGVGWSLGAGVDEERIRKVLAAPWTTDGKTFSDRIWSNQEALVSELSTALTQMIMRGEGPLETADTIAKKFNVNRSRAATLVYTESAAFAELSRNDCYSDLGVERCRVDGTLDGVTCANCGTMDGTVLRLADCKVGVSTPPFHPRCRCTTVPHYDDWEEFDITPERIARNIDTGEHFEVPANMTYEQWKEEQDKRYGSGTVDKKRKMHYNEKADRAQYQKYIDVLGDDAPNTFSEFQIIRYSDDWGLFKAYASSVKSGELTPLVDFDLYKKASVEIDSKLVGQITSVGTKITGRSKHFISRVFGSVSQRRSGVQVDTVLETVKNPERVDPIQQNEKGNSQRYIGDNCVVIINPDKGMLIQTNPRKKRKE